MDTKNKNKENQDKNSSSKNRFAKYFTNRKKEPNFFLSVLVTSIKLMVIAILVMGFAGFGALLGIAKAYVEGTPELDVNRIEEQSLTSFIYDKDGNLIAEYKGLEHRIWAPLEEIPEKLQQALIATEDVRFYTHKGLDYKRLAGAFINNLRSETVQGGSTITQQLIKNTLLSPEQTYKRKIQEAYLAIQLEQEYEKDEILEAYLNTIYLGSGNYGVKAAAINYFGKELKDLNLRECAALVGITKNPYRYDLRLNFYSRNAPEVTYERTNLVLRLMYENGFITREEYEKAKFDVENPGSLKNADFVVLEESSNQKLYDHPYFVEYVINELVEELMKQNNWEGSEGRKKANNLIQTGGLHIYTTLDPEIQKIVEDTIYNYDNYPSTRNSKDSIKREKVGDRVIEIPQPQAAAVVLDHSTGELRAIVGGRMDPQERFWNNRANQDWAPGSSIKPIAVYAPFIEAGYPGGYIIEDIPVPIDGWDDGGGKGYPSNYTDTRFYGPVTAKRAVQNSYNISAARTLLERVGVEYSMNKLKELGITGENYVEKPLPSNLSLGSDPINMIEVTAAFGTLANRGVYKEPTSITKVLDREGNIIIDKESQQLTLSVFKESTAFIITDWLQNAVANGTGTRARFSNMSIAGKTGTNNDFRGVFFAGYTPYYTATVMIGHDTHSISLRDGTTGGVGAAPLWKAFMEKIHEGLENKPFYEEIPEGVRSVTVCAVSGKLPTDECAETVTDYFPSNAVPKDHCDMHRKITVCGFSGKLPSPYCPEEHLITKSVIVLPKDSKYQQLTDEQLSKIEALAGAFRSLEDLDQYDYNNPDHADKFCPLHTAEWHKGEEMRDNLAQEADQLIAQISGDIVKYADYLKKPQIDALNKIMDKLKELLTAEELELPGEDDPYYTEIPSFKPDKIQEEMDRLRKTYESIFDSSFWESVNAGSENGNESNNNNSGNKNNGNVDNNGRNGQNGNNHNKGNNQKNNRDNNDD
ncbi:MAG: penicillin-binding protein [Clostridiales bacterium]|jgi:penicillin-binding protein 1A|nr:penicillin-binding protein [Clostridiales bacterium]